MLFLLTGGTIDKMTVYLPDGSFDNDSKVFGKTHLPEMLENAHFQIDHSVKTLFMIDSLDMTDKYRTKICNAIIEDLHEDKIIITHGTDTMPETAKFLKRDNTLKAKTIVLTGAMVPYSVGAQSDAMFNIGNAIAYAQTLPPGVYVAMNGRVFDADNVRKDTQAGIFTTLK